MRGRLRLALALSGGGNAYRILVKCWRLRTRQISRFCSSAGSTVDSTAALRAAMGPGESSAHWGARFCLLVPGDRHPVHPPAPGASPASHAVIHK